MKAKYHIEGMTCNGCRTQVEQILNAIPEVKQAEVNLENKEASLIVEQPLDLDKLRKEIPQKYIITEKQFNTQNSINHSTKEKKKVQQLFPLFLILGYITIAAVLLNYNPWNGESFMMDFMGLFYIVFSFFKLLDISGFSKSFAMYDPLASKISFYARIYPFIEIILGLMFLMRFNIHIALIVTIVVLNITTFGVTKVLLDKRSIQCACLGTALKLPMTKATFIENAIMLGMAILMLLKMYING
ncbi:heavy-metal-associated domain-containing protein [Aquimarina litoralis]|uniref:heavy-metal-associated domain-containing protein n=1 Tax=Aquimarina litoralis TaxID=584605 RepID=UPI001C584CA8|nr:MauE/DoxX family redox-associated membrane protein [Aquimarina litoralis]MBW1295491.1 heavy metal transporter [Aquimarina litoralis]